MKPSAKHKAEFATFAKLEKVHGYRFGALKLGMTTDRDRFHTLYNFKSSPAKELAQMVSFVVTVPVDSGMGKAFVEYYAKPKAKKKVRS